MKHHEHETGWLWLFVVAILAQPMIADMVKRELTQEPVAAPTLPKMEIREPRL